MFASYFVVVVGKLINECSLFTAGGMNLPSISDKSKGILVILNAFCRDVLSV